MMAALRCAVALVASVDAVQDAATAARLPLAPPRAVDAVELAAALGAAAGVRGDARGGRVGVTRAETADGAREFWVAAPGDPARAPLFGVLALDFLATDVDGCAALARDAPPALNSRRVFDVFPFFNERDVLEVRLREHDDVVDVFVPVEGSTTHSGGPKDLAWRDGFSKDADFGQFAPRVRGHVANLSLGAC